jgi:hypothetical protein
MTRKAWFTITFSCACTAAVVAAANYSFVAKAAHAALTDDAEPFKVWVHWQWYANPRVLVLDLRDATSASPKDLVHGIIDVAEAMRDSGRRFKRVQLVSRGKLIYYLEGSDFERVGDGPLGNRLPTMLKLASQLHHPDGSGAFSEWEGGILGVISAETKDMTAAMLAWSERALE